MSRCPGSVVPAVAVIGIITVTCASSLLAGWNPFLCTSCRAKLFTGCFLCPGPGLSINSPERSRMWLKSSHRRDCGPAWWAQRGQWAAPVPRPPTRCLTSVMCSVTVYQWTCTRSGISPETGGAWRDEMRVRNRGLHLCSSPVTHWCFSLTVLLSLPKHLLKKCWSDRRRRGSHSCKLLGPQEIPETCWQKSPYDLKQQRFAFCSYNISGVGEDKRDSVPYCPWSRTQATKAPTTCITSL